MPTNQNLINNNYCCKCRMTMRMECKDNGVQCPRCRSVVSAVSRVLSMPAITVSVSVVTSVQEKPLSVDNAAI